MKGMVLVSPAWRRIALETVTKLLAEVADENT